MRVSRATLGSEPVLRYLYFSRVDSDDIRLVYTESILRLWPSSLCSTGPIPSPCTALVVKVMRGFRWALVS